MYLDRYVFANVRSKVSSWVKNCLRCQQCKVARHQHTELRRPPTPSGRFEALHVDIVGPLPSVNGFQYLFTIVDRFTRYPEAVPIPDATAVSCARALLDWVSRFGLCLCVTSDRGRQFVSDLWKEFWSLLGVQLTTTCAYMPQQNGLVERMHRQLKASLAAALMDKSDWLIALPIVLMGLRSALKPDIGSSPAEMVFGKKMRLPGQFFSQTPQNRPASELVTQLAAAFQRLRPTSTAWHRRYDTQTPFVSQSLATATHVFVRVDAHRSPLSPPYRGPFRVVARGDKAFSLDKGGVIDTVAIDRLKPAFLSRDDQVDAQGCSSSTNRLPVPQLTSETLPAPAPSIAPTPPAQYPTRVVWSRRSRPVRLPDRYR